MSQPAPSTQRPRGGGLRLSHVLIFVIIVVGLILLYKKGMIPSLDRIPSMSQITERLPSISLPKTPANTTNQGTNASIGTPEGELLNDEWIPPSDDNAVYQDSNDTNSTSLMTQEPVASTTQITQQTPQTQIVEYRRSTRSAPVRVNNPPDEFPANLAKGYYTVQVYAGYYSKTAYSIKRSLEQDGYLVYIYQIEDKAGILFRVRVGRYANLNSARAVRDQIRRRYPKLLSKSFVLMRQPSY